MVHKSGPDDALAQFSLRDIAVHDQIDAAISPAIGLDAGDLFPLGDELARNSLWLKLTRDTVKNTERAASRPSGSLIQEVAWPR